MPNDVVEIRDKKVSQQLANNFLEKASYNIIPEYLEFEKDSLKGKVKRLAENTETNLQINEHFENLKHLRCEKGLENRRLAIEKCNEIGSIFSEA